jgi:D-sedoheptulose 7-phosphate isomerase
VALRAIADILENVSQSELIRAVQLCIEAKKRKSRFFFIGNGGSAAIASHMAADFLKAGGVAAQCFNDGALLTCLANDLGYEQAFARPLSLHGRERDVLFAISSSGKSKSITNAAETAQSMGMKIVTLSGFTPDNRLRALGHVNFYVSSSRYGLVEVAHHAICHSVLDAMMEAA